MPGVFGTSQPVHSGESGLLRPGQFVSKPKTIGGYAALWRDDYLSMGACFDNRSAYWRKTPRRPLQIYKGLQIEAKMWHPQPLGVAVTRSFQAPEFPRYRVILFPTLYAAAECQNSQGTPPTHSAMVSWHNAY